MRKECGVQLRDAGERFCKEMLVNARRDAGETTAALTDYDEKTLEWLCPRVDRLLRRDPSHSGKLEVFKKTVNRACHDNAPPGSDEMIHACGVDFGDTEDETVSLSQPEATEVQWFELGCEREDAGRFSEAADAYRQAGSRSPPNSYPNSSSCNVGR